MTNFVTPLDALQRPLSIGEPTTKKLDLPSKETA
jgi:hypothetical protein